MSLKKIMLVIIALSFIMSFAAVASAAAKAKAAAPAQTANADSVGVVDRGEILNNHPELAQVRQRLADIARQKENEAKAAAAQRKKLRLFRQSAWNSLRKNRN